MMKPIENWDNITPETGEYTKLPAGGYVCKIISAMACLSKSQKEMLKIAIDIAEGEYKGMFEKMYLSKRAYEEDPKWSPNAVYYQLIEGDAVGRFKGLITNLEASNPGFKWGWDESKLKGLKFGGLFREEEYINNKNELRSATRIYRILPVEGIEEKAAPSPKKISGASDGGFTNEDVPF